MAKCRFCESTILGGVKDGDVRYCNNECAYKGKLLTWSERIAADHIRRAVTEVHQGPCPQCNEPGPVDVFTAYKVYSALVVTVWKSSPQVSCRKCGYKTQAMGLLQSLTLGWWGFPFGLIVTPIQIARNLVGMTKKPDPYQPSPQLERAVRFGMAERMAAQFQASNSPASAV